MKIVSKTLFATSATVLMFAASPAYAWTFEPYQSMRGIPGSSTCPNAQCQFTFPPVPDGMRLLVTSVSAQVAGNDALVLEGSGVTYFVAKANPSASDLNSPVTLFYEAGQTPTARIFAPDTSAHSSLIVTIVGQLDPQ